MVVFQLFCFLHCTDENQKSETIVCSWKNNENYDKLTWNFKKVTYVSAQTKSKRYVKLPWFEI